MQPLEIEFRRIYQQLTFHLDNSPLAVIEWDQQLSVKRWSPQAEKILGWTAEEMLHQAWDDRKFVHQDDLELVKAVRARLFTGAQSHNTCLHRNYTKDQAVVYCEWHYSALRDESGQVVSLLSWVQDVTERQREALKQSQTLRKQQVIAELSQCALNQTNLDTLLKQVTRLVAETLGVKFVQILELLPNEKTFLLTAGVGWLSGSVGRVTMGTGRKSQSGYTVLTQEPVIVEDLRVETRFSGSAFLHNHKVISGVTVQIPGKEKPFGVLGVYSQTYQSFSEDDINFLKVIANIISSAVERQQREDELNRFFNLSLDIFCIASVDGYFKRINPRFAVLLGYPEAELLHASLLSFLHPDDITPTLLELENLALGIPRYNFENRYQCKNGSYRWLSWTAMPFDDHYFYAVARDITDSKQTEAALRNSEKRYANLTEVSPVGIFHTDIQGNCLYVNQRWLEITGLSSENALGIGWLQAIHPEDYDQVAQEWNQAANQQIPFQSEYRFQRQDGKITWVFGQAVAEVNEQGETIGYVGTITNITDRKQAEEELKQLNEELEDRVADRTTQLSFMNEKLQRQISELQEIEAQLEVKVYQQAIIAKLGQKALSETNLPCLIAEAVVQVAQDLKVEYCKLIEWNGEEIAFLTLAIEDKASESYVLLNHEPIQIDNKSYCFNSCMNPTCNHQKLEAELLDYASFHLFNRGICIPILGQNHHHLGQVEIYGKNLQIFTEDDVHYLQSVSHILATAIERKQAEEAIRSSEQLYRLMADHSTDLISRHTGDGVYLYASPACRSLLGYEPEELIGHCAYEFFHPEDLPNLNQYYQNLTENSQVKTIVYRMIGKNQKYVWFETTSKMVLDNTDNAVPKIVAVSRDITDRKLTEDRLKAANEQLQAVLDAVPGFVSWISADLHYLGVNRHLALTYNLNPEDFAGQEIGFLLGSHEFAQFMKKFMGETYLKTSEVTLETNIQGSTRYYLLVAQKYNQDQAAIFVGIDITDRKRIEEQLWATTCRLSALIDNLQLGVLVQDEFFQVVLINQAFCNLFGIQVPPEELIGLEGAQLFCDYQHLFSDATQFTLRNREVMRRKRLLNNEEISLTDGRVLERDYVPILIQGNNSQGHLWMYRDITERKNAEGKLVTSLREKEVLLKEIHHRVKNNLFVVSNLLEFQTDYVQEPELIKVLDDSRNRIYSMALIHEKLYRSTNLDQVNFGEYLEDLVDNLFESYNVQSGLIEFELDIEPVSLNIETAQPCGLIVNELISNTLKHAFPDSRAGIVYLGLQQDGESGQIILTVRDNGIGFPEDVDFRNVESLGMELVCTLTDQLEGTITLERDQGTIFTVRFYELQYRHRLS